MNPKSLLIILLGCLLHTLSFSQNFGADSKKMQSTDYRRSSIYTIMLDDKGLIKADTIKQCFESAPIPDKFNDHTLPIRTFNPLDYQLSEEERLSTGDNLAKSAGKSALSYASGGLVDTTDTKDLPAIIQKFFRDNRIPQQLVAKWYNRDEEGRFNMELIAERGMYDATEMKASVASKSVRGRSLLADAGEELIGNTFVVVSRYKYIPKEEVMGAAKRGLDLVEKYGGRQAQLIAQVGKVAADVASKGYVIQTYTYLYKLRWNDSITNVFYNDYWIDENYYSEERKHAFDTTSLFQLDLVGYDKAWADLQSTIFTTKSEDELIKIATVKALDAVIAKLQRAHDVFKTKSPLYSVNPLAAKIGLKEGLEKGDKYEVLEQTVDENGRTKYVRKGVITVDKQIWDNRYMAGEAQVDEEGKPVRHDIEYSLFKGSGKYYPGLLIRQIR